MRVDAWLHTVTIAFADAGLESARLDALILLEDQSGRDRSWLLAHPEYEIAAADLHVLADTIERRMQHEPLAYIRGFAEFYGRRFVVNEDVLIPRSESESMIDMYKKYAVAGDIVADIGTGSGCLAISAALETEAVVWAVDIDEACLAVAKHNAVSLKASITLYNGSLLQPFPGSPDVILANLPYVPVGYPINEAARHEPAIALFAGSDGLDDYRALFGQVTAATRLIITESLEQQHAGLTALAAQAGYTCTATEGLAQVFIR